MLKVVNSRRKFQNGGTLKVYSDGTTEYEPSDKYWEYRASLEAGSTDFNAKVRRFNERQTRNKKEDDQIDDQCFKFLAKLLSNAESQKRKLAPE